MSVLSGWRKPARFDCSVLLKQVKPCTGWVVPAPTYLHNKYFRNDDVLAEGSKPGQLLYTLPFACHPCCSIKQYGFIKRETIVEHWTKSTLIPHKSLNSICVEGRKNWRKETKTEGNRGRKKEERRVKIRLYGLRLGCKYFIYIYLLHRLVSGFRQSLHSPQLRTQVSTTWSPKDNAKSSDMYGACILSRGKA